MRVENLILCKNTGTNYLVVILLFIFFSPCLVFSQSEYRMNIENVTEVSENIFEFEVYIKSSAGNIYLTSYQCSFLFNSKEGKADRLSFSYIDSTSQLTNPPTLAVGINDLDGELKLTFASLPGLDTIMENYKCLGRFRLQNKTSLVQIDPNITWNFEGFVTTILTGESFQNITNSAFHNYDDDKQSKFKLGKNSLNIEIPNKYELFQNYPNPFNPSTTINFGVPNSSFVSLKIYDVLGREVTDLVSEIKSAGNYEVTFNASELSSGIYFYKLQADNFIEIKKMTLIK
jgi:hypothetical protein